MPQKEFTYNLKNDFHFHAQTLTDDAFDYIKPLLNNEAEACLAFLMIRKLQNVEKPFNEEEFHTVLKRFQMGPENVKNLSNTNQRTPKYNGILIKLNNAKLLSYLFSHQFKLVDHFEKLVQEDKNYVFVVKSRQSSYSEQPLNLQDLYKRVFLGIEKFFKKTATLTDEQFIEALSTPAPFTEDDSIYSTSFPLYNNSASPPSSPKGVQKRPAPTSEENDDTKRSKIVI